VPGRGGRRRGALGGADAVRRAAGGVARALRRQDRARGAPQGPGGLAGGGGGADGTAVPGSGAVTPVRRRKTRDRIPALTEVGRREAAGSHPGGPEGPLRHGAAGCDPTPERNPQREEINEVEWGRRQMCRPGGISGGPPGMTAPDEW